MNVDHPFVHIKGEWASLPIQFVIIFATQLKALEEVLKGSRPFSGFGALRSSTSSSVNLFGQPRLVNLDRQPRHFGQRQLPRLRRHNFNRQMEPTANAADTAAATETGQTRFPLDPNSSPDIGGRHESRSASPRIFGNPGGGLEREDLGGAPSAATAEPRAAAGRPMEGASTPPRRTASPDLMGRGRYNESPRRTARESFPRHPGGSRAQEEGRGFERWSFDGDRDVMSDYSDDSQEADLEKRLRRLQKKLKKTNLLRPKDPPKYDGTSKYSELENWLYGVEMYLDAKGMLADIKAVPYVATLLSGAAATWWRYHRVAVRNGTAQGITHWDEFAKAILAHFRPENAERIAMEKLQRCTQSGSVRDYNQRIQLIMVELPEMNEKTRVYFYLAGLKSAVKLQVELQYPRNLSGAMELAELADTTIYRSQQSSRNSGSSSGYSRPRPNNNAWTGKRVNNMETGNAGKETRTCFYCGKVGHLKSKCKKLENDKKNGNVKMPTLGKHLAGAGLKNWKKEHLNLVGRVEPPAEVCTRLEIVDSQLPKKGQGCSCPNCGSVQGHWKDQISTLKSEPSEEIFGLEESHGEARKAKTRAKAARRGVTGGAPVEARAEESSLGENGKPHVKTRAKRAQEDAHKEQHAAAAGDAASKTTGVDTTDWMFDRQLFLEIDQEVGPFTVDICSDNDGQNSQCKRFYCPEDSVLKAKLDNETVWGNLPYNSCIGPILRHFKGCQSRAPTTTAGVFVLPKWERADWWHLTKGWHRIREYATGSQLFSAPPAKEGEPRRILGKTKWPVVVFYSPYSLGSKSTASARMGNGIRQGEPDHSPQQQDFSPRLGSSATRGGAHALPVFYGTCGGHNARFLIDSGASADFAAASFVKESGLTTRPPFSNRSSRQVKLANGLLQRSNREIVAHLRYGGYKERRNLLVTTLEGYDIILGQPWLRQLNPIVDWRSQTIAFRRNKEPSLCGVEVGLRHNLRQRE